MTTPILRAATFAAHKHRHQRRKDQAGTPYINHPLRVATLIAEVGKVTDESVLQAALLHDTVEDTDTTVFELELAFGAKVAGIVMEVTDDKSLPKVERKRLQIEHAAHASYEAKLVKLADKLDNLTDQRTNPPSGWSRERVLGYYLWSFEVIKKLRGTNVMLEARLMYLYNSEFYVCGTLFAGFHTLGVEEKEALLAGYYKEMETTKT